MGHEDRVAAAAACGASGLSLLVYAVMAMDWVTPKPLIIAIPALILTWAALYNIAKR